MIWATFTSLFIMLMVPCTLHFWSWTTWKSLFFHKIYNYHILGTLDFQVQSIGLHVHVICLWAHVQPWILTWARLWVTILCLHCRSQYCAVLSSICRWWISARSHSLLYSTTTSSWTFLPCTPCSVVAIY